MPRVPDEFSVHFLLEGGHREEVRFRTIQEFQKWYTTELVQKSTSTDFINVPIKTTQNEYFLVRPSSVLALRIDPVYAGSIDREM